MGICDWFEWVEAEYKEEAANWCRLFGEVPTKQIQLIYEEGGCNAVDGEDEVDKTDSSNSYVNTSLGAALYSVLLSEDDI